MILSGLTDEEILRIIQPSTDLERELISRLIDAGDEINDLRHDDHVCGECNAKDDELTDLEERITYLEERLDEYGIKYEK